MGQQQILLLVLGIVLVGLAVVVGIEAFGENRRKFRQDQTVHLVVDIATRAQLWKMTAPAMGGGDDGDPSDFSDFRLTDIGLTPTRSQSSSEVIVRTEYACLRVSGLDRLLRIQALDVDCSGGSWWLRASVTGPGRDDIALSLRDGTTVSGNGQ